MNDAALDAVAAAAAQTDLSQRLRLEAARRASEDRLRQVFELMPDPVAIIDHASGRYLDVNRVWEQLYGWSRAEAIGRTTVDLGLWADPGERVALRERITRERELRAVELQFRSRDGRILHCEMSAALMESPAGEIGIWIGRDIGERKRTEEMMRALNDSLERRVHERTTALAHASQELMRVERMAALGRLVAGVAHELATPLGNSLLVATSFADATRELIAALQSGLRRALFEEYLATAQSAAQLLERNLLRASELIASFKQVAADQTSAQRRPFDLAEIVAENIATLQPGFKSRRVDVRVDVAPGIRMDSFPGPLGQVIANLVNNAFAHAFEGRASGVLAVEGRATRDDEIELVVRDDGAGIPAPNLGRVFDPFFTTRLGQGGSGLGLNIVHNLVTGVLGGRIDVVSEPDCGTAFTVTLPTRAPPVAAARASEAAV